MRLTAAARSAALLHHGFGVGAGAGVTAGVLWPLPLSTMMRAALPRLVEPLARLRAVELQHSPDAIPAFATAAPAATLAPMPTLEINAMQPWLISPSGNVAESTRRLAVMNLALRGIEADFSPEHADTFLSVRLTTHGD